MVCGIGFLDGVGGRNVIDFVCVRDNCNFKMAVETLMYELKIDAGNYKTTIPKTDVKSYKKAEDEESKNHTLLILRGFGLVFIMIAMFIMILY